MKVNLLIGANAYACIEENGRKTDILLSPGKSAPASLREYASDQRERAARLIEMADLAERAALELKPACTHPRMEYGMNWKMQPVNNCPDCGFHQVD